MPFTAFNMSNPNEISLSGLRNLDSLGLAHNKLKEVPAKVFSHLTLLNSLELEGNNIVYIDREAFSGLEGNLIHSHRFIDISCLPPNEVRNGPAGFGAQNGFLKFFYYAGRNRFNGVGVLTCGGMKDRCLNRFF